MIPSTGHVLAVDQGTSSTKAIALDAQGRVVARESVPVAQRYPRPGWVEQDPVEIADGVRTVLARLAARLPGPVAGVGLSTQRESVTLWETAGHTAVAPLLSWQDRRTAGAAATLARYADEVRSVTGLPLDPMFSALKLRWLLDAADRSRPLTAGTVDAWLLAQLTGARRVELGNASRTQLLDIESAAWSGRMLEIFGIPAEVLPEVVVSTAHSDPIRQLPGLEGVPVTAVLADSHASLFAHGPGRSPAVKVTYGTGSSVIGTGAGEDRSGPLVRTIAWAAPDPLHAFEGNILSSGSTLTWLARLLNLTPADLAARARPSAEPGGPDLVPAFAGLGAPWWDPAATGTISGLTLDTDVAQLAWAALESIALQVEDVLRAAALPTDLPILADGGGAANPRLMQLQADLSQRTVWRSDTAELSAVGAAHLAGLSAGVWDDEQLLRLPRPHTPFHPKRSAEAAAARIARWHDALARARLRPPDRHGPEEQ
ncbi:glycerol kinase [Natronosporangium hydrolyticum]|uniref:ATP:glycerol 3-phosphotransferase n=1 Tax=Natronosporangium hydrolyticum TaxID=2811111 RepID=A0A895YF99_9ACTN|nr:FGGY family carbohydrate kinase [Natronosporangium hydrolyticum]QSB12870.1 glycerol kinase [Natronosporangium hydrolyticum]